MKLHLDQLERMKSLFEPNGKLEKFYPLYEATDTFLFTPGDETPGAPHVRDARDMKRTMITVLIAMMSCVFYGIWRAGHQHNVVNQIANTAFIDDLVPRLPSGPTRS